MTQSRFNNDFDKLLKGSVPNAIAVAVSGGADSISLLYLVFEWSQLFDIKITVLIVNHNLRVESSEEVDYVRSVAKNLGCRFFELSWQCGGSKIALQERARAGRYDLMSKKCHDLGIDILLTAHHEGDMLETYLMRQSKKSGVFGLSSSNSFFYDNIRVLRPLSNFSKEELVEYLQSINVQWREDTSNKLDVYERNRVRKQISSLGNDDKRALKLKMNIANEDAARLNHTLLAVMAESLQINNYGFAKLDLVKLREACADIKIQILNYVLTIIAGRTTVPRFRSIEKILSKLDSKEGVNCSLHGCILRETNDNLLMFKEKSFIDTSSDKIELFQYWDNRFNVSFKTTSGNFYLSSLNLDEYVSIKDKIDLSPLAKISDNNHKQILFTLPVIKNIEKIVAIPHISYYDEFDRGLIKEIIFRPNFISRFTHFL